MDEFAAAVVEGGQCLLRALGLEGQHGLVEQAAGLAGVASLHRAERSLLGWLLCVQKQRHGASVADRERASSFLRFRFMNDS